MNETPPLSNGVQEVINAIRKVHQYHEWDVAQIAMALSAMLAKDQNSHIHEDTIIDLDMLADYLLNEHI